jgi:uncharacterized protein (DUF2126 family)
VLKVTPDPGVIEVNIHPAASWDELVETPRRSTNSRARAAWARRNSCWMAATPAPAAATTWSSAAATPEDSPFLRRPDLLRSLVGYWHNHPSLSYLFSGLFIGPTSQHPRVDEARTDAIYELEIAFDQIPRQGLSRDMPAVAGRSRLPAPADRSGRQHASRRVLHRQALLARRGADRASAWWNCARSRCRRTRA